MGIKRKPFVAQHDAMDCGPACLAMISEYYGKKHNLQFLRDHSYLTREGVSLMGLREAADYIGMESCAVRNTVDELAYKTAPVILFWNACHFVVLYSIHRAFITGERRFTIADPAKGLVTIGENDFINSWCDETGEGVCFMLEPTQKFFDQQVEIAEKSDLRYLFKNFKPHTKSFMKLGLCLIIGSLLTMIMPFLTQSLIDDGVSHKSFSLVTLTIGAQLAVFTGSMFIEVIRNWIVLYVGARINIDIITTFFEKITRLPFKFFDTKFAGDFYQRVNDHTRIELFLTSQTLTTVFSLLNFSILFFVLFKFNMMILGVYLLMTVISIVWSVHFMNRRERLDYLRFKNNAQNQEAISEMIYGIQDLKLNGLENYKIKRWKEIQVDSFKINLQGLKLDQLQLSGFEFINQFKNLIITFIAAILVIDSKLTIGGLLTISFIIGQMNSPMSQLVAFFRSFQDARLSMRRLSEVHAMKDEGINCESSPESVSEDIELQNVSFQYEGPSSPYVLHNISCKIPKGKVTAIVGASGSGKSTLLKLLMQFYEPTSGNIMVGGKALVDIVPKEWRHNCGVVMQDGFLFSETIARNIATGEDDIDYNKLSDAIQTANLTQFVDSQAKGYETMVGAQGNGISGGQRQRLLIARAVYKDPPYLFLDEATSSLDTENEFIIHDHLNKFFVGRTVVIIAHRLSTVRNADNIIVLKDGEIAESGTHQELLEREGEYYKLIKTQL